MKIALVSLDPKWEDKSSNILLCEKNIRLALENSCKMVIFPEMTLTGFSMNVDLVAENPDDSKSFRFFQRLAKEGIFVVFGMALKREERVTNNLIVISPNGDILANYAKIHPFSYSQEDKFYDAGTELGIVLLENIKIGMTICYDLRFPEIYQGLSKTVSIIVNIANWPKERIDHWNTLIRARAIENQVYMIGVNRIGVDGNDQLYEASSMIIDPDGREVLSSRIGENIDLYEVDPGRVGLVRKTFPFKEDRNIELYKRII
jgi:omega-amidase